MRRAIRFSKIIPDFCSPGLNHVVVYLKRPGVSDLKVKNSLDARRSISIVKMAKSAKNQKFNSNLNFFLNKIDYINVLATFELQGLLLLPQPYEYKDI